ncbi:GlcNAc-transferase family protein [Granulicella tundricola]|uniref:Glycosyltransferase (GlcNAc) n=1 Tax=Granulicella tundricola (strain ATCC BAA-1859 / DSM 23138 / MP5ACTX9) TaxID=1198114 RepID=E8X7V3_GRATM|nr:GlcNAc-transferase family protein [Granulicella tundricola]ADW71537.1 hypothetical protein AciX9_4607 [Granulicella tundricola MP5ACTX9]
MGTGNELIFISIASYRDSQLIPTVEDLVEKADEPELLRIDICWQHGEEQPSLPFAEAPGICILDVPWQQSYGACWARAEAMKLWRGEQWFLQIDSHCRFIKGWDTKLIRMMQQTGSVRPILSTYANTFIPAADGTRAREALQGTPQLIALSGFSEDGLPKLKPLEIPGYSARERPMGARFLAGGFIFAPGSFVEDVPYDPDLYFFGEEIAMTLRAFTSGYDLFHPVESVAWHDYARAYATRHWDDRKPVVSEGASGATAWRDLDRLSRERVASLLRGETAGEPFGLGTVRTIEEYETHAGLSFRLRRMQDYTRRALEPPNPPLPSDWTAEIFTWMVRITVHRTALSACAFEEAGFWVVAIQDEDRHEIDRHDVTKAELSTIGDAPQIVLIREIHSGIIPESWSVQPFGRSAGWGPKISGKLDELDYSIIMEEL